MVALAALALAVPAAAQDADRSVKGGGIMAQGWQGKVDAAAAKQGKTIKDSRFEEKNGSFHISAGSASTYWNPANTAKGDYTVSATFNEPKYMSINSHPHPYGIVIGGNDMGTDNQSYLYCAAYGNGNFIVRGFGPAAFQLNGRGEANAAVNKAAGQGEPVTQEIAVSVKGDKVECAINGKTVASYDKANVVGAGKLKSTDGLYGIRFAHNTEATVSGLTLTKQ